MIRMNSKGKLWIWEKPVVMGIINTTPDSFYSGSRTSMGALVEKAGKMLEEGAAMLDIGGQSTRPGSDHLPASEEVDRVLPAVEVLHRAFPDALLSIDTFYAEVARTAVAAGAGMVNDISGGTMDHEMLAIVGKLNVPFVCTHIKGTTATMKEWHSYTDVALEVLDFFIERKGACLAAGIKDVIMDPGFGFGKNIEQNFELLRRLELLKTAECPLLIGISRKGMIWKTLNTSPENALNGTTVLHTIALMKGAAVLRAHDVREARECVDLILNVGF